MLQILSTSNETSTGTELVQNGNFSEIGSDLVTNGDFSAAGINLVENPNFTDTGADEVTYPNFTNSDISQWVMNSGRAAKTWDAAEFMRLTFLIANGQAMYAIFGAATVNASYKVTMRVRGTKSDGTTAQGSSFSRIGDNATIPDTGIVSNPTLTSEWQDYEFYIVPTTTTFRFYLASADIGDLVDFDSISVKELGADWDVLDDTCTFGEYGLTMTSTEAADVRIRTNGGIVADSTSYKVTYTINDVDLTGTNAIQYYTGSALNAYDDLPEQGIGTHTFYYTTPSTITSTFWFFRLDLRGGSTSTTDFVTISSISVQELGEGWTLTSGASITALGAKITHTPTAGTITQYSDIVIGKSYKFTYEITETVSGGLKINNAVTTTMVTSVGTHTRYFEADSSFLQISRTSAVDNDVTITNISVQELDPNGYWTLGTGWSIGDTKAISTVTGSNSDITQSILTAGKTYRTVYEIVNYTDGTAQAIVTGSDGADAVALGTYTEDLTTTGTDFSIRSKLGTLDGAVSSVSVKQLGTYEDQSIYVTAADVQTIAQASVYYLIELTSMGSKNSLYFLPSSVVPNNGRYTKLNFTVISKDAIQQPTLGIISFYDSVGGLDTYPMGFYEFKIYEQTSSTNLDPLLSTGLLEKGFAFVRDFSGNMQELTDGFKEYTPALTQYVYSK